MKNYLMFSFGFYFNFKKAYFSLVKYNIFQPRVFILGHIEDKEGQKPQH